MNGEINNVGEEKWAKHYSSNHEILLVGEGDFSFSLSLATSFASASNIVATSLDSYDVLIKKYKNAESNLKHLINFGAQVLQGVDATKLKLYSDLQMRKFDRIVYNFPHSGFWGKEDDLRVIRMHRKLVCGFFKSASGMLRPDGEVHIAHKTTHPFDCWNIEELASENHMALLERVEFKIQDYPGYNNKRGDGKRSDEPFPLGKCTTFKFILTPTTLHRRIVQQPREIPLRGNVVMDPAAPLAYTFWIFSEYFNHARSTFGQADDHLIYSVRHMLQIGFERYTAENHGRPLSGYINILEMLWDLTKLRIGFLQNWLWEIDHQRY